LESIGRIKAQLKEHPFSAPYPSSLFAAAPPPGTDRAFERLDDLGSKLPASLDDCFEHTGVPGP
jgi:hypothetical protein